LETGTGEVPRQVRLGSQITTQRGKKNKECMEVLGKGGEHIEGEVAKGHEPNSKKRKCWQRIPAERDSRCRESECRSYSIKEK